MQGNQCGLCSVVCATLCSCVLVLQQIESFIGAAIHQTHTEYLLHMLVPSPCDYEGKKAYELILSWSLHSRKEGK